jgi:hypothetical protein
VVGADFNSPYNPISYLRQNWSGWSSGQGMAGNTTLQFIPIIMPYYLLLALFQFLGLSIGLGQAVVFGLIVAASGVSMWWLLKRWIGNDAAAFAGGFVYMVNPFTMIEWHNGHSVEQIGWALCPLVLLVIDTAWTKEQMSRVAWFGVVGTALLLPAAASNPASFIAFILVPVLIYLLVQCLIYNPSVVFRVRALRLIAITGIFVAANLWWIGPGLFFVTRGRYYSSFSGQPDTIAPPDLSIHVPWFNVLVGLGYWGWLGGFANKPYFTFAHLYQSLWFRLLLLLPWVVALEFLIVNFSKLHRRRIFLFSFSCIGFGLFMAAGFHGPFGIFEWAYRHVPGFVAFRSPWERFGGLPWLGLAVVMALFISKRDARSQKPWFQWSLAIGVAATMAVIAFPLFDGMFLNRDQAGHLTYYSPGPPNYVTQAATFLGHEKSCLVFDPEWNYQAYVPLSWNRGPYSTANSLLPCETIAGNGNPSLPAEYLADAIDGGIALKMSPGAITAFLRELGVTDVLIPRDYDYSFYRFGPSPAQSLAYFRRTGLPLHQFGKWTIFSVPTSDSGGLRIAAAAVNVPSLSQLFEEPTTNPCLLNGVVQSVAALPSAAIVTSRSADALGRSSLARLVTVGGCPKTTTTVAEAGSAYELGPPIATAGGTDSFSPCSETTIVDTYPPKGSSVTLVPIGRNGFELTTQQVTGNCVINTTKPLKSPSIALSFAFKTERGARTVLNILQNGVVISSITLPEARQWTKEEFLFGNLSPNSTTITLNVAPESQQTLAQSSFQNIEIAAVPGTFAGENVPSTPATTFSTWVKEESNGSYVLHDLHGSALVSTKMAIDPGWHLDIVRESPNGKVRSIEPVTVNVFEQGWIIRGSGSAVLRLTYSPSRIIRISTIVSVALMCLVFALISGFVSPRRWFRRKHSEVVPTQDNIN